MVASMASCRAGYTYARASGKLQALTSFRWPATQKAMFVRGYGVSSRYTILAVVVFCSVRTVVAMAAATLAGDQPAGASLSSPVRTTTVGCSRAILRSVRVRHTSHSV